MSIDEFIADEQLLEDCMNHAITEAHKSEPTDVPIGAVIFDVTTGDIIASAHNEREKNKDATCHAEVTAVKEACAAIGDWRLNDYVIFSTLEPCVMCAGTLSQARIGAVVFGASDDLFGAAGSIYNLFADPRLPHNPPLVSNVLEEECSHLVSRFFASKR
jgi:tRNA(adenine34) deaminase